LNFLVLPRIAFITGRILALASVSEKRLALIFQNPLFFTTFFRNFAVFDGEITPSRQKKNKFFCFALDFS